jgi:hypothetical protein
MALNNRYLPSHPAGSNALYGLDLSAILPFGVGLAQPARLDILYNTVPPTAAPPTDFNQGALTLDGRRVYCQLQGGVAAKDYRLSWVVQDTLGNTWIRDCLLLCAATS